MPRLFPIRACLPLVIIPVGAGLDPLLPDVLGLRESFTVVAPLLVTLMGTPLVWALVVDASDTHSPPAGPPIISSRT